jgi:hypothetical protein
MDVIRVVMRRGNAPAMVADYGTNDRSTEVAFRPIFVGHDT